MAFKFRFENLLRYKENIEKQKSVEFLNAEESYKKQKKKLELLEKKRQEIVLLMKDISSSPSFDLVSFNMMRSFLLKIEEDIAFEKDILHQLKIIMDTKRKELIKASQDKKIMEKLKEKDHDKYVQEENRKEIIELDEITLKKYNKGLNKE